ncbi:HXXXD-type acyl-transferase family protein [Raphanus sativus]|uniref:BAHD acyltransferase At3g29680-like n=1 Tax=Raphanus sativus TaxID=3726 RepID=A0A6J0L506_RAPSA|nr:BAHD acyltransferase At3g29680-like [Raphanus sativus]KAJ4877817.1 HXXXD-type acyl-transferase family protein [Raphanus sativus]
MEPKVIKISHINPATDPSRDDPLILPLTFLDLRWVRSYPSQQVIFYKLPEASSREFFHSVLLPKLERSLSLALRHYTPLAGHLTWNQQDPKPRVVVYGHDTVKLTVAESSADFLLVSGKGLRPQSELRVLVPKLSITCDSASLYALQITLFPNQGFCIGLAEHHVLKDGTGSIMFVKAWAHICKSLEDGASMTLPSLPKEFTPVIDRTLINVRSSFESKILESMSYFSDEKDGMRTMKPPPVGEICNDLVRITLEMTQEKVERLKEQAMRESLHELYLSTFVIVNAYVWSCLVKARGVNEERPLRFMYAADCRDRLDVPKRYLGNCVVLINCIGYKANKLMGRDGFVNAVEILSDSVKGLGSQGTEELLESYIDGMKLVQPDTHVESVSGSNRLGFYRADFGWGKPVNHEIVSIDQYPAYSMWERRDETGGAEIGLCLKKSEMNTFVSLFKLGLEIIDQSQRV